MQISAVATKYGDGEGSIFLQVARDCSCSVELQICRSLLLWVWSHRNNLLLSSEQVYGDDIGIDAVSDGDGARGCGVRGVRRSHEVAGKRVSDAG